MIINFKNLIARINVLANAMNLFSISSGEESGKDSENIGEMY